MAHWRVNQRPSPSPPGGRGGLSPPPLPPPSVVLERDAKALQAMLQEIDDNFHVHDYSNERRLRLHQLGEQQMVLQRLCKAALQTEESQERDAANDDPLDAGIVLTPRSLESLSIYGDTAATAMGRSVSRTGTASLPMSVQTCEPPKAVSFTANTGEFFRRRPGGISVHIESPAVENNFTSMHTRRRPLPPLISPTFVENGALEKDRRLVEEFLDATEEEPVHPYATMENKRQELSNGAMPLVSTINMQRQNGNRTITAPLAEDEMNGEHFDVKEEEQVLKYILQKEPRSSDVLSDVSAYRTEGKNSLHERERRFSALSSNTAAPNQKNNKDCNTVFSPNRENMASCSEGDRNDEMNSTRACRIEELLQANNDLQNELEAQDVSVRELTQKAESLARHLVKSMRDRTELQERVEGLEASLESANSEIRRLQKATEKNKVTCGVDGWRAAVHAKEREVRICEEEICRLRGVVEQRVMRSGNALVQHSASTDLIQVKSDVEDLILELASAQVLRREAEAHAERVSEELEAAQSHIQLLDTRLAEAERAVASQRLQEMRDRLLPESDGSQAVSLLSTSPTFPTPLTGDVANWPIDIRREFARLTAYAEGLVVQHAESDRYAEIRLSQVRQKNEELLERCRAYESGAKALEEETATIRRERMVWKLREKRWHQQLLDVQEDAALVEGLVQAAITNSERVLNSLALPNVDPAVKAEMEMFIKGVMREWDTVGRFTATLRGMKLDDLRLQQQNERADKLPLSAATKTRREFVLQAVEAAMKQKSSSSLAPGMRGTVVAAMDSEHKLEEEVQTINWHLHNASCEEVHSNFLPPPSSAQDTTAVLHSSMHEKERQQEANVSKPMARPVSPPVESPRKSLSQASNDKKFSSFSRDYDHGKRVASPAKINPSQPLSRREEKPFFSASGRRELVSTELPTSGKGPHGSVNAEASASVSRGSKRPELALSDDGAQTEEKTVKHSKTVEEAVERLLRFTPTSGTSALKKSGDSVQDEEEEEVVEPLERDGGKGIETVSKAAEQVPKSADGKNSSDNRTHLTPGVMVEAKKESTKINRVGRKTWGADVNKEGSEPRLRMATPRKSEQNQTDPRREQPSSSSPTVKPKHGAEETNRAAEQEKESHTSLSPQSNTKVAISLRDVPNRIEETAEQLPAPCLSSLDTRRGSSVAPSLQEPQRMNGSTPVIPTSPEETVAGHSVTEHSVTDPKENAKEVVPVVGEGSDSRMGRRPSAVMDFPSLSHPSLGPGRRGQSDKEKS